VSLATLPALLNIFDANHGATSVVGQLTDIDQLHAPIFRRLGILAIEQLLFRSISSQ
jgi:hypothetical protein